jgi:hypothetical protein
MALIDEDFRPICTALRDIIVRHHPGYVEVVWQKQRIASYGVGPKKMSEHYAYIAPQKNHVNLGFYHGAALSDPGGMLEGTGKNLRHTKIRSVATAEDARIIALVAESITEIRQSLS